MVKIWGLPQTFGVMAEPGNIVVSSEDFFAAIQEKAANLSKRRFLDRLVSRARVAWSRSSGCSPNPTLTEI